MQSDPTAAPALVTVAQLTTRHRMLTQPGELRLVNARRVLMASLQSWPCTKPELARRTGLSQMTIGKVVTQLLGLRLLEKVPSQTGPQHGRPPIHLRPSSRKSFVGLELGFRGRYGAHERASAGDLDEVRAHRETGAGVEARYS